MEENDKQREKQKKVDQQGGEGAVVGECETCLIDNHASWTLEGCSACILTIKGLCPTQVVHAFIVWHARNGPFLLRDSP